MPWRTLAGRRSFFPPFALSGLPADEFARLARPRRHSGVRQAKQHHRLLEPSRTDRQKWPSDLHRIRGAVSYETNFVPLSNNSSEHLSASICAGMPRGKVHCSRECPTGSPYTVGTLRPARRLSNIATTSVCGKGKASPALSTNCPT